MKKVAAGLLLLSLLLMLLPKAVFADSLPNLTFEDISIEERTAVTRNLTLMTAYSDEMTLSWTSSDENVITTHGTVIRPMPGEEDAEVTLTATASDGSMKTFSVTVLAFTDVSEILTKVRNDLTFSVLSQENIMNVTKDLYLPARWNYDTFIYWTSNNESILRVDGETGTVKQPPFGDGLSCVILTAHIVCQNQTIKKSFMVRVAEQSIGRNYSAALQTVLDKFDQEFMAAQNLLSIRNNLVLPAITNENISVSFVSQNPDIITPDGIVTRDMNLDKIAEFAVNFSYGYERTRRSYAVVVKAVSSDELTQKIEDDLDWVISVLGTNHDLTRLSENLVMPQTAPAGSVMHYTSQNTAVLGNDGIIHAGTHPQTVILMIQGTLNGVSLTRSVSVTVLPANSYQGDKNPSGGGGGSVGGSVVGGGTGNVTADIGLGVSTRLFSDVPTSHWAYDSIRGLKDAGIVSGDDTGSFRPDSKLTREELVKMVVLAANVPLEGTAAEFADLPTSDWSYPYVAAGYCSGLISGRGDGTFGKGDFVTRQDAAVIIFNTLQKMNHAFPGEQAVTFADGEQVADYARGAVAGLNQIGLINGKGNNMFMPLDHLSRAEAAAMLWRMLTH